jgi:hypothetical protein
MLAFLQSLGLKDSPAQISVETVAMNRTVGDSRNIDAIVSGCEGKNDTCVTLGGNGSAQEGITVRNKKVEQIVSTHFAEASPEQKGRLLDALILDVAGREEFDKMRLGLAMVESLQEFILRMGSSSHANSHESKLMVLGAHAATIPAEETRLGNEYERRFNFRRKKHEFAREVMRNPTAYQMKTGPFEKTARGLSKTKGPEKMNAIQFWMNNSSPRMLGSGEISKDTNHLALHYSIFNIHY